MEPDEFEDWFWIWSCVTSEVRRSFSKRSCETAIFTLPLLRLKRPPVEMSTAGSLLDEESDCELLETSIEPELLPSEPDEVEPVPLIEALPVAEPAPDVPLDAPRLPDEPVVEPECELIEPDEPDEDGDVADVPVEERFATERSEAARSDCERVAALRVPEVSGVVAEVLPVEPELPEVLP